MNSAAEAGPSDADYALPSRSLGPVIEDFRPSTANLIAGIILGVLCFIGGSFLLRFGYREITLSGFSLPLWGGQRSSWLSVIFFSMGGLVLVAMGMFALWRMCSLFSFQLLVHVNGIYWRSGKEKEALLWVDTAGIRQTTLQMRVARGVAGLMMPKATIERYTIYAADGRSITVDANSIRDLDSFAYTLRREAKKRNIPWEVIDGNA